MTRHRTRHQNRDAAPDGTTRTLRPTPAETQEIA